MASRTGRWSMLLLLGGALFLVGLGAWFLGGDGDLPIEPAPTPLAATPSVIGTPDTSVVAPTAEAALNAASLLDRTFARDDEALSVLPEAVRRRMTPAAAAREYFDSSATFDYRGFSTPEVRAAEYALVRVLLERMTGPAHAGLRSLLAEYQSTIRREPAANWLWRQEHVVESAALLEEVDDAARVSVVVRFTRWFADGGNAQVRSALLLELARDAFGVWRISGWEALSDTLLP